MFWCIIVQQNQIVLHFFSSHFLQWKHQCHADTCDSFVRYHQLHSKARPISLRVTSQTKKILIFVWCSFRDFQPQDAYTKHIQTFFISAKVIEVASVMFCKGHCHLTKLQFPKHNKSFKQAKILILKMPHIYRCTCLQYFQWQRDQLLLILTANFCNISYLYLNGTL